MKRNIVTTSLLLAVACIGLVAYAGYESEHRSEKTKENPKCTSRNVGSSCQRRLCFRVTCFTGESSCTPTNWDCGPLGNWDVQATPPRPRCVLRH